MRSATLLNHQLNSDQVCLKVEVSWAIEKHRRRVKSIFRYGFDDLRSTIRNFIGAKHG